MIIYSRNSGAAGSAIGAFEAPIKMIIEHESDFLTKQGGVADLLFNIEKSSRFAETIIGGNEFSLFSATKEGEGAESDTIRDTYAKYIEHIQFMKEFTITAEMMEDANYGIAADAKRRAENFTRAYYKTMNRVCEYALAEGTRTSTYFAGANIDLTTPDGFPLFYHEHLFGADGESQCNFFWGDIFSEGEGSARTPSTAAFERALSLLTVKLRNMRDENGSPLGYTADTIILPGNRPIAETIVKKVVGSQGTTGGNLNDINLHFGNWNVVILPGWICEDDRVMIMSSEANKNLCGNMFFNRIPLTVTNWVDNHTGNYIWNGRCRFGVGFGSYKHILLAVDSTTAVENALPLQ